MIHQFTQNKYAYIIDFHLLICMFRTKQTVIWQDLHRFLGSWIQVSTDHTNQSRPRKLDCHVYSQIMFFVSEFYLVIVWWLISNVLERTAVSIGITRCLIHSNPNPPRHCGWFWFSWPILPDSLPTFRSKMIWRQETRLYQSEQRGYVPLSFYNI